MGKPDNLNRCILKFSMLLRKYPILATKWLFEYGPHKCYHFVKRYPRRITLEEFCSFIGCGPDAIGQFTSDLKNGSFLKDFVQKGGSPVLWENKLKQRVIPYYLFLYYLVRIIRPEIVVETGVAAGQSTAFILKAMSDNEAGQLFSIDLPEKGTKSGWLVSRTLRDRWSLMLGDSRLLLEPLVQKLKRIDIFFHDSLHTFDHMLFEYSAVWPYIHANGFLLSHDWWWNPAFCYFSEKKKITPLCVAHTGVIWKAQVSAGS